MRFIIPRTIVFTDHLFHPVVSVHKYACMVCRKLDEISNQDGNHKSIKVLDWLLHRPSATPRGKTGRRTNPSPVRKGTVRAHKVLMFITVRRFTLEIACRRL